LIIVGMGIFLPTHFHWWISTWGRPIMDARRKHLWKGQWIGTDGQNIAFWSCTH